MIKKFLIIILIALYACVISKAGIRGDVNADNRINVSDVTALINMILGIN